jgi:predicted secreted protein
MTHDDLLADCPESMAPAFAPDDPGMPEFLRAPESGATFDERARAALECLFGARTINDGHGMIKLEAPHIVEPGTPVPVSVDVNWPMVLAKAVARLYLIADGARDPLARVTLIPDLVPPHVRISIRLDEPTTIRAVVECGDGTLLQAQRWVWVMPPDEQPALG